MQRNRDQSIVQGPSNDAFREGRGEHLRKEGEDIKMHRTRSRMGNGTDPSTQRWVRPRAARPSGFFRQGQFLLIIRHSLTQFIRLIAGLARRSVPTNTPTPAPFAAPTTEPMANRSQSQLYGRGVSPQPRVQPSAPAAKPTSPQPWGNPHLQARLALGKEQLLHWLHRLADLEQSLFTKPLRRPFAFIVSHADPTQKQLEQLNVFVPTTIRFGLLGAIVLVMWWTWPSSQLPPTVMAQMQRAEGQSADALRSLAIVNAVGLANQPVNNTDAAATQLILRPTPTPADGAVPGVTVVDVAVAAQPNPGLASLILVPTMAAANVVMPPIVMVVPQVRLLSGVELKRDLTREPPTPTPTPSPTPEPINLDAGRLWSTFVPQRAPDNDHYWVGRPFGDYAATQLASPSYQFGSTAGDRYRTHHGVDISNPQGTPVLAATDGEVVHAGLDDTVLLGPYNNFYGNTVVIRLDRQLPVASGQLDVFLLYGHLSQVNVQVGQKVRPEDVIGAVGMTGIAIGPHLHVEIRLGSNTYYNNVNPYLWLSPLEGQGSVAVRVLTADGRTWQGAYISIVRYAGASAAWARQIVTYMDTENIGPDPAWGENGAMDGIPAGSYYVVGAVNGERVSAEITVRAGETTFVELRTNQ